MSPRRAALGLVAVLVAGPALGQSYDGPTVAPAYDDAFRSTVMQDQGDWRRLPGQDTWRLTEQPTRTRKRARFLDDVGTSAPLAASRNVPISENYTPLLR